MRKVDVSPSYTALVDDEDYEKVKGYKWYVQKKERVFYAYRFITSTDGQIQTVNMAHQIIGFQHGSYVDHINHNGLDNRKENLRIVSPSQNAMNSRPHLRGTSKYKGVSKNKKGRWRADIRVDGKNIYLKSFATEIEAAEEYNFYAMKYFGGFAYLNKINYNQEIYDEDT